MQFKMKNLVLLALMLSLSLFASEKRSILFKPFDVSGTIDSTVLVELNQSFHQKLSTMLEFKALPLDSYDKAIEGNAELKKSTCDLECLSTLGKEVKADFVLQSSLVIDDAGNHSFNMELINSGANRSLQIESFSLTSLTKEDISKASDNVKLFEGASLIETAKPHEKEDKVADTVNMIIWGGILAVGALVVWALL